MRVLYVLLFWLLASSFAYASYPHQQHVYDGWRLVSELDGLSGNRVLAEYVPGPTYVDDTIAARRDLNRDGDFDDAGEGFLYYLTDQQHSTVALIDGDGNVVERYGYDPFGAPTIYDDSGTPITASAYGNNRLYTGRDYLPALGLYDYRQRMYDPAVGRFLTTDPAYDPNNLGNPYTYVGNNPGAFVDPYGEDAIDLIVTGQWNPDDNTWQQAYGGFGLGAAEGHTVVANAATLGLNTNLNTQAQAIKADARARGDVVSQIGFGLGEVGVEVGYAAATLGAGSALTGTARASSFIAAHPVAFARVAQGGAVLAAGSAGYNAGTAIDAVAQGDVAGAVTAAGRAGLSGMFAASAAQSALGTRVTTVAQNSGTTALAPYYPANNGFLGSTTRTTLYAGSKIDRFGGSDFSRFFSPVGTPLVARALPPGSATQNLRTFEVLKPFEAETGTVALAFGQLGLGTQYRAPVPLRTLLKHGVVREITR
jgi:RHS repeat-associated protein